MWWKNWSIFFKDGEKLFISETKFCARWTDNKNKLKITFGKATLKVAISFVLNNCFVNFGNLSFRKITGISMGSQVVPFTTNLFLYYYENKWLLDTE